jgi:alpha-glucosidase
MNKLIKKVSAIMLLALIPIALHAEKVVKISSPNKKITVDLSTEKGKFGWTVSRDGAKVYTTEDVRMIINGKTYAGDAAVKNVKQKNVNETIKPVVPIKFSTIESKYTEAIINFGGIYPFDTVSFLGHLWGKYEFFAFDGSKFYSIGAGYSTDYRVTLKLEAPIESSYQIKITCENGFAIEPDFMVY